MTMTAKTQGRSVGTCTMTSESTLLPSIRDLVGRLELPPGQFFTPNESFWLHLRLQPAVKYIECGAGNGYTTVQALQRGLDMSAVDIAYREDTDNVVLMVDATLDILPWSPRCWPLICRPSHGGWAGHVMSNAIRRGASTLYVGLERNVCIDIPDAFRTTLVATDVGLEGESMYVVSKE